MAKPGKVLGYEDRIRKPVPPGQKVPLTLSNRERELILEHTFADDELTAPLRIAPTANKASVYSFTLDGLEELAGYVAAEANQPRTRNVRTTWTSCSPGWKRCWNPTRTSTTDRQTDWPLEWSPPCPS